MQLNIHHPPCFTTMLLFTTVRISAYDAEGNEATGTGFFYDSGNCKYIVTNKHVIEDTLYINFPIHAAATGSPRMANLGKQKIINTSFDQWIQHPDIDIDLCCLPIEIVLSQVDHDSFFYQPISSSYIPKIDEIQRYPASTLVAMIGYPNGLWDEVNGLPIIRTGTTASHPAVPFNAKQEVVLDMACFPGSSGSPVMFNSRSMFGSAPKFLGVLYAGPTITNEGEILVKSISTSNNKKISFELMMHLGFVITAEKVQELSNYI